MSEDTRSQHLEHDITKKLLLAELVTNGTGRMTGIFIHSVVNASMSSLSANKPLSNVR